MARQVANDSADAVNEALLFWVGDRRAGKSPRVSVILKLHFIGCFAIRVLPQVVARTSLSPLFLGNGLPYLVGRVLGEYPEQSNGGTTHILTSRGQERAQLGQDVLSNHLSLDVHWCGKTKEVRGVQSTAGVIQALTQTVDYCLKLEGTSTSLCDGAMPDVWL